MMKEWATVISWQNGIALLRCEPHSGCGNCHSRRGCGSHLLNELGPETDHQLQVEISQPLEPGQKVEVGISEGSLLRSASLVYLTPLVGLIAGGALFQSLFLTDAFTALGAILGAGLGFYWHENWQPELRGSVLISLLFCKSVCHQRLCVFSKNKTLLLITHDKQECGSVSYVRSKQ